MNVVSVAGTPQPVGPFGWVFTQAFASREEALAAELQIKGWSRKKKEALVQGDWAEMSQLAQRRKPFR